MKLNVFLFTLAGTAPALAHPANGAHLHENDSLSLILGLVLIAVAAGAAAVVRARSK